MDNVTANTKSDTVTTPGIEKPAGKAATTVVYPLVKSTRIRLVRKNKNTVLPEENTPYSTAEDYTFTVGGAFAGFNNPLPLGRVIWDTPDEENRIMGLILASNSQSPDWAKLLNDYWNNYRVSVPFGGLTLEIGMIYQNETDPGTPINPTDYVLWRYCLKYNAVANDPADAGKSPRIRLILISEELEVKRATAAIDIQDRATMARLELLKDDTRARAVLAVMDRNPEVEAAEVRIQLADLQAKQPEQFLRACNDDVLLDRAFVKSCIRYGLLKNPINSDMVILGDNRSLGNIDAAIAWLNDPDGQSARLELLGQLERLRSNK